MNLSRVASIYSKRESNPNVHSLLVQYAVIIIDLVRFIRDPFVLRLIYV